MLKIITGIGRWIFDWLYFVCLICFIGAMLGIFTHLAYALLFMDKPDWGYMASFGFMNGFKYGSVWAGGAAIVLCVIRARREFLAAQSQAEGSKS
ncbi:MAG: hypothetical protein ACSHX8_03615 [Opitutaceae bacterium]